ncbi:MAG: hypothetical protein WD768_07745 [Phycisphaeraceae bacterium]
MGLATFADIWKLLKAGAKLEAQERIMELRQAVLDAQEQVAVLREENAQIKAKLAELDKPALPPCPKCGKRTWGVTSSKPDPMMGVVGVLRRTYTCSSCNFSEEHTETGTEKKGRAERIRGFQ